MDYKWRTFSELPAMEHVVMETPIPTHRFHAVGVGEIATSPGPSAVLMLLRTPLARGSEYPVTPAGAQSFGKDRRWRKRRQSMKWFEHHNARSIDEAVTTA